MAELSFFILCAIAFGNIWHRRDPAFPPFLYCALWALIVLAHNIWNLYACAAPLSNQTYAIVVAGAAAFSLGGVAMSLWRRIVPEQRQPPIGWIAPHPYLLPGMLFLSTLAIPFMALRAQTMTADMKGVSFFVALRGKLTNGGLSYGIFDYAVPVAIFTCWLAAWLIEVGPRSRRTYFHLAVSVIVSLILITFMTGRTYFLLFFCIIGSSFLLMPRPRWMHLVIVVLLLAMIFGTYAVVLHKMAPPSSDKEGMLARIGRTALRYAIGPLRGFDKIMLKPLDENAPLRSLRFVRAVGHRIGFNCNAPVSLVRPVTKVPFEINVYTVYEPYWADFGFVGVLLALLVFGTLHTWFYFGARAGRMGGRFGYALLSYPLVMSFFQDQWLSMTSTWLQYLLLYLVTFCFLVRYGIEEKSREADEDTAKALEQKWYRVFLRTTVRLFRLVRYHFVHRWRHNRLAIECIAGQRFLVLPSVFNPVLYLTGDAFSNALESVDMQAEDEVLEIGTGCGLGTVILAKRGGRVLSTDVAHEAIRCARINAILHGVEDRTTFEEGNLFEAAENRRFDIIVFHPPFLSGDPSEKQGGRTLRCGDIPERFSASLAAHLSPGGTAWLFLSSAGVEQRFLDALSRDGLDYEIHWERDTWAEIFRLYRIVHISPTLKTGCSLKY